MAKKRGRPKKNKNTSKKEWPGKQGRPSKKGGPRKTTHNVSLVEDGINCVLQQKAADTLSHNCKCSFKKNYGPNEEMFNGLHDDTKVVIHKETENRASYGMRMRSQINYPKISLKTESAMVKDSNENSQQIITYPKFYLNSLSLLSASEPQADLDLRNNKVPPLIIAKSRFIIQNSDEDEDKTPEYPLSDSSIFFLKNTPDGQNRNLFSDLCSSKDSKDCNTKRKVNCPQCTPGAEARELVASPSQMKFLGEALKLPHNLSPKVQRLKLFPKAKNNSANSLPGQVRPEEMSENDINTVELPEGVHCDKSGGEPSGWLNDNQDDSIPQLSPVKKGFLPLSIPQQHSQPLVSAVGRSNEKPCIGTFMEDRIQSPFKGVVNQSKCVKLTETVDIECDEGNSQCCEIKDNISGYKEQRSVEPSQPHTGKGLTDSIITDLHVNIPRQLSPNAEQMSGDDLSYPQCLVIDEKIHGSQDSSRLDSSIGNRLLNLSPSVCDQPNLSPSVCDQPIFLTDSKQTNLRENDEKIRNDKKKGLSESQESPWIISEIGQDVTLAAGVNVYQRTNSIKELLAPPPQKIGSHPSDQLLTGLGGQSAKLDQLIQNSIHKQTPSILQSNATDKHQNHHLKDSSAVSADRGKGETNKTCTLQQEYIVLVCPVGQKQETKASETPDSFSENVLPAVSAADDEILRNLTFVEQPVPLNNEIDLKIKEKVPLELSATNCCVAVLKSSNEDNVEEPTATELCMNRGVSKSPEVEKEIPQERCGNGRRMEYISLEERRNESASSGDIVNNAAEFENSNEMDGSRNELTSTLESAGDRVESVCTSEDTATRNTDVRDEDSRNKVLNGTELISQTEQSSPDNDKQDLAKSMSAVNQYVSNGSTCTPEGIASDNIHSINPHNVEGEKETFSKKSFKKRTLRPNEHKIPAKKVKPSDTKKHSSLDFCSIQVQTGAGSSPLSDLNTAQENDECDLKIMKAISHCAREKKKSKDEESGEKKILSQVSPQLTSQEPGLLNSRSETLTESRDKHQPLVVNPAGVQQVSKTYLVPGELHHKESVDNDDQPHVRSKSHPTLNIVSNSSQGLSQTITVNSWHELHTSYLNKDGSLYPNADGASDYSNILFPVSSSQQPLLLVNSQPPPLINTRHLARHHFNDHPKPSQMINLGFYEMPLKQSTSYDHWDHLGMRNDIHQPLRSDYTLHSQRLAQQPGPLNSSSSVNSSSQHPPTGSNRNLSLSHWAVPSANSSIHPAGSTYVSSVPVGTSNQPSSHVQMLQHPEFLQYYNVPKGAHIVNTGAPVLHHQSVAGAINSACLPSHLINNHSLAGSMSYQEGNRAPPPLTRKASPIQYRTGAKCVDHFKGHQNALLAAQRANAQSQKEVEVTFPYWVKVPSETNPNNENATLRQSDTQRGIQDTDINMDENWPRFNLLSAGDFRMAGKFITDVPDGQLRGHYETRASQSGDHDEARVSQSGGHHETRAGFVHGNRQIISSPKSCRQENMSLLPTPNRMPLSTTIIPLSADAMSDNDTVGREPLDLSLHSKKHPDTCDKQTSKNNDNCSKSQPSIDKMKAHHTNTVSLIYKEKSHVSVIDKISSPKNTPVRSVSTTEDTFSNSGVSLSYIENSANLLPQYKIPPKSRQMVRAKIIESSNNRMSVAHSLQSVGMACHPPTTRAMDITDDGQSFNQAGMGCAGIYPPTSGHPIVSNHPSLSVPKSTTMLMSPLSSLDNSSVVFSRVSPQFSNTSSSRRTSIDSTDTETSVSKASDVFSSAVKDYFSSAPKENTYSSLLMAQIVSKSKRPREENTVTDEIFGFIQSAKSEPCLEVNNAVHKGQVIDLTENDDIVSVSSNENNDDDTRDDLMREHTRSHFMGTSSQDISSLDCGSQNDNSYKYLNVVTDNFSGLPKQRHLLEGHIHGTHVAYSPDGYHRNLIINCVSPGDMFEVPESQFSYSSVVLNNQTHYDNNTSGPAKESSIVVQNLKVNPAGKEKVAEKLRQKLGHHTHQDLSNLPPFQNTIEISHSPPTHVHTRDGEDKMEPSAQQAAATLLMLSADPLYNNLLMTPEGTDNYLEKVYQIHPTLDDNEKALESNACGTKGTRTGRRVGRPPKDDDRSEANSKPAAASSVPHSQVPVTGSSATHNYMPMSCHLNAIMCSPTRNTNLFSDRPYHQDSHFTTTYSMNTINPLFFTTSEANPVSVSNNSMQKLKHKYIRAAKHQSTPASEPLLVSKEFPNAPNKLQIIHQANTGNLEDPLERVGPPPSSADVVIKKKRKRRTKQEMLKAAVESAVKPHRKYKTRQKHSSHVLIMENQYPVVSKTTSSSSPPCQGLSSQNGLNYPSNKRRPSQSQQYFEENYPMSNPSHMRNGGDKIDEIMHETISDGQALNNDRIIPQTHNEDGLVVLSMRAADSHRIEMEESPLSNHHLQINSCVTPPFSPRSSKSFHDHIQIQSLSNLAIKHQTKSHSPVVCSVTSESPSRQTVIRTNRSGKESETLLSLVHSSTNGIERTEQEVIAWLATQTK